MDRLRPHFPKLRGKPWPDDRTVLSGIIHVKRNGRRWRDAPAVHGPYKALCNRFVRWSRLEVLDRIFRDLARPGAKGDTIMMDSPIRKVTARRQASQRGLCPRAIGRTKGGSTSKLHMVHDGRGRPLTFFLSPGQMSDARGALVPLADLPHARRLLGDRG